MIVMFMVHKKNVVTGGESGGIEMKLDAVLISVLGGSELSASRSSHFTPRENSPSMNLMQSGVEPETV
jgi:hypothetical protein